MFLDLFACRGGVGCRLRRKRQRQSGVLSTPSLRFPSSPSYTRTRVFDLPRRYGRSWTSSRWRSGGHVFVRTLEHLCIRISWILPRCRHWLNDISQRLWRNPEHKVWWSIISYPLKGFDYFDELWVTVLERHTPYWRKVRLWGFVMS